MSLSTLPQPLEQKIRRRNDAITLAVPQADLEDLNRRIDQTRWPDAQTVDDWTQGAPLAKVKALVDHWRHRYDWRRCEATLNGWGQYKTTVDGLDIHFLHEGSKATECDSSLEPRVQVLQEGAPRLWWHGVGGYRRVNWHKAIARRSNQLINSSAALAASDLRPASAARPGAWTHRQRQCGWREPVDLRSQARNLRCYGALAFFELRQIRLRQTQSLRGLHLRQLRSKASGFELLVIHGEQTHRLPLRMAPSLTTSH